jgi:hypothetical protein
MYSQFDRQQNLLLLQIPLHLSFLKGSIKRIQRNSENIMSGVKSEEME